MTGENWLDDVLAEISEDVETPKSWLWWSLLSAVSASCGNNYFLRSFSGKHIYKPNLYVMLLGESGLGKAFGINLSKLLVQATESTRVIAGRSSIQAIVSELAKSKSNQNGALPILDSRGFIVNGELSTAVISDEDSLTILTDLYDGHVNAEWNNMLKMTGTEKLKEPYITALFGSSPSHFYDKIPAANIEGGYIGRNLIVYEEKRARDVDPLGDIVDDEVHDTIKDYIVPKYSKYLTEISKHKGRLIYTNNARELYNSWRRKWRVNPMPDKTGFINRVPDHVLKVSMLLCLSRYSNAGVISEQDIQDAITKVTELIYANRMTSQGKTADPLANQTKVVLDLLIHADNNQLMRKMLLSRGYPYGLVDTSMLDKIIETLLEMNWIERERIVAGKNTDWLVKLSGEPLMNYRKFVAQQLKEKK